MAAEAQILTKRPNAQRSTGPRTAEGKAAVSKNAVRHGLPGARRGLYGVTTDGAIEPEADTWCHGN